MSIGLFVIYVFLQKFCYHTINDLYNNEKYNNKHHTKQKLNATTSLLIDKGNILLLQQECPKKVFQQQQQQHLIQSLFDYYINEYDFFHHGGIIIYFHIAKTGGTTIRKFIRKYQQLINSTIINKEEHLLTFKRIYSLQQLKKNMPIYMKTYLNQQQYDHHQQSKQKQLNPRRRILFLELHGNFADPVPGMIEFESIIQSLRNYVATCYNSTSSSTNDEVNHQPKTQPLIFFFTLLRSPIHFYVSYFNAFKRPQCKYSYCHFPTVFEMTESTLLQTALYNHQCFYLYQHYNIQLKNHKIHNYTGFQSIIHNNNKTIEACQLTHQYMYQYMDYIGITETISNETLPLLLSMINPTIKKQSTSDQDSRRDSIISSSSQYSSLPFARKTLETLLERINHMNTTNDTVDVLTSNQNPNLGFSLKDVSINGIKHLQELSSYDKFMYDCAIQNFNLSSTLY